MKQYLILVYCGIVFHCIDMPHLFIHFLTDERLGCFHSFDKFAKNFAICSCRVQSLGRTWSHLDVLDKSISTCWCRGHVCHLLSSGHLKEGKHLNKFGGGEERWGMRAGQKTQSAKGSNQYFLSLKTLVFFVLISDSQLVTKLVYSIAADPSLSLSDLLPPPFPSLPPLLSPSTLLGAPSPPPSRSHHFSTGFFSNSLLLTPVFPLYPFPPPVHLHTLVRAHFSQHLSTRNNVSAPAQKSSPAPLPVKPSPNSSSTQLLRSIS